TTPTLPSEALIFLQGEYPNPGDLIEFQRVGYQHWAIFVGDKDVVHLTSRKYLDGKSSKSPMITREALVKKDPLNVVAGKSNFRVNNKYDEKETPLPTQKVVKAALENVGQTVNYNITTNNCEHFVTKLKYETAVISLQTVFHFQTSIQTVFLIYSPPSVCGVGIFSAFSGGFAACNRLLLGFFRRLRQINADGFAGFRRAFAGSCG
uniref:LRAT domain-containing protein n=1 Tax=Leptobrachium leishanense TaxID=445787 RepID=A0A8C5R7G4_9ANUR